MRSIFDWLAGRYDEIEMRQLRRALEIAGRENDELRTRIEKLDEAQERAIALLVLARSPQSPSTSLRLPYDEQAESRDLRPGEPPRVVSVGLSGEDIDTVVRRALASKKAAVAAQRPAPYSCPICGTDDPSAYMRCHRPNCTDGRDPR